jgi:hypothetical protein
MTFTSGECKSFDLPRNIYVKCPVPFLVPFLDSAGERLLLRKVSRGYKETFPTGGQTEPRTAEERLAPFLHILSAFYA